MKAIYAVEYGGPEKLIFQELEEYSVGVGEVCVRLYAAGVNPSDTYTLSGTYSVVPSLPYTPGIDGAGIIEAIGEGVQHVKVGDRVFVAALPSGRSTGTFAQKIVCNAQFVHSLPEQVSFEQGASLGVPALTAYRALFHRAKIQAGQTVFVHGASGGVGLQVVQMAKAHGAIVIGTASRQIGKDLVKSAGADHVIDHVTDATVEQVLELTNGKGPDIIIEFLANANLETDLKMVAKYGTIVVIGNRGTLEINPRLAMQKECAILGTMLWNAPNEEYDESIRNVFSMLESGTLRPVIGTVLPLEQAKQAFELIGDGTSNGKLVLKID